MLKNYLKIAYKVLMRQKFFTFVSLFGISITLTIVFVVVAMVDTMLSPGGRGSKLSQTLYVDMIELRNENNDIESLPSYNLLDKHVRTMTRPAVVSIISERRSTSVYVGGRKLQLDLMYADAAFWDIAEFHFLEGGPYQKANVDNVDAVAVINERTRAQVFGAAPAVGQTIETTSGAFRVTGVVPTNEMPGPVASADMWVPITQSRSMMAREQPYGAAHALVLPARSSDVPAIRQEFEDHLNVIRADLAGTWDSVTCVLASPVELVTREFGQTGSGSTTMFVAIFSALVILFMLLPAMNLVNMNVSRIFERSSEIGVRKAFGASVSALVWQFIIENVLLTLVGGAVAIVLTVISLDILNDSGVLAFAHFTINPYVLVYSLIISLFFGVFSGALPAYRMSRLHPVEALRGVTT